LDFTLTHGSLSLSQNGVGNNIVLTDEQILKNVQEVQQRNGIEPVSELDGMNFSIETETGTGKTYVYLRTIYELNKQYGFNKFVIVVTSVAIREGVLKNLEITYEHFQTLYDKGPFDFGVYDSGKVSQLRGFASSNTVQVLVMNIDAFAKECETREDIEFYFKLPFWFHIDTPIGKYNPDWALVFKDEKKIYFVAETKSTKDLSNLRNEERLKIKCGTAH